MDWAHLPYLHETTFSHIELAEGMMRQSPCKRTATLSQEFRRDQSVRNLSPTLNHSPHGLKALWAHHQITKQGTLQCQPLLH